MTLRVAEPALTELVEAARSFNRSVPGLGDTLAGEVRTALAQIAENPAAWRIVHADVRRSPIERFPFGIFYTVEGESVVVWSIRALARLR